MMTTCQDRVVFVEFSSNTTNCKAENVIQKFTFKEIADEWLWVFKRAEVTPRTLEWYMYLLRYLNKEIENIDIRQLDVVSIQKVLNNLSEAYSVKTVKDIKITLNSVMEYAIDKNIIQYNPTRKCKIKKNIREASDKNIKAIPPKLRNRFLIEVRENAILNPIVITMMFSGMRPGELIALRWGNLDFRNCIITINSAVTKCPDYDINGNLITSNSVIASTKTQAGNRKIKVSKIVFQAIKVWECYLKCSMSKRPEYKFSSDDFVFPTKFGKMRTYSSLKSLFDRFNDKYNSLGLRINPHMLRHTFATMLLEKKINPKVVQQVLGHSDVQTTLSVYSHVFNEVFEETAKTMDEMYSSIMQGEFVPPSDHNRI